MTIQQRRRVQDIGQYQDVLTRPRNRYPGQLSASPIRLCLIAVDERTAIGIIEYHNRVEFLALRFVGGHDVDTAEVISPR